MCNFPSLYWCQKLSPYKFWEDSTSNNSTLFSFPSKFLLYQTPLIINFHPKISLSLFLHFSLNTKHNMRVKLDWEFPKALHFENQHTRTHEKIIQSRVKTKKPKNCLVEKKATQFKEYLVLKSYLSTLLIIKNCYSSR